ncbi:MAG: DUF3592 domain-containing protein [Chloroflexota bacterium]
MTSISLFQRAELLHIGRTLGALLVLFGGLALMVQSYFGVLLPTTDGFQQTVATIIDLERIGTFQSPAFFVTLEYTTDTHSDNIRSGQQVEFEQYFDLTIGQEIDIRYNPQDMSDWRIEQSRTTLSDYGLGLLMMVFGAFALAFPTILRFASRQEDFELKDELDLDEVEVSGVNVNSL